MAEVERLMNKDHDRVTRRLGFLHNTYTENLQEKILQKKSDGMKF
jgi:hypothetical protein